MKKLVGHSFGMAAWATNVGNEFGQVLISVLTASEGSGLAEMAAGLVERYKRAGVPPPSILYPDRDCCGERRVSSLFDAWVELLVRLDCWHFMCRITSSVTTESHPLNATFMAQLSQCIFEWSDEDLKLLKKAKAAELAALGIRYPSDTDVAKRLSKHELSLHVWRRTRGVDTTIRMIEQLLAEFTWGDMKTDCHLFIQEVWHLKHSGWH